MMFNRVLLAIDRTTSSWRALPVAEDLADRIGAPLELVHVTDHPWTMQDARADLEAGWRRHHASDIAPTMTVLVKDGSIAHRLSAHTSGVPGTLLVMDTRGRGRSQAVLGSVTLDVLTTTRGPLVAVGHEHRHDTADELVIPVDGSPCSEAAVMLGAALAVTLGARPWVVTNVEPIESSSGDVLDSNEPRRLARRIAAVTGERAEYEVLHSAHSGAAVADFARSVRARMIVCSTHGRTGWARLALGSVGAEIVRHAPCPVTLIRPAALAAEHNDEIAAMTTLTNSTSTEP
jgi:nucleotide-binding universal stress UspA family protein